MLRSKKILAVVPARGGSKGIPLKNLKIVGDKTLLEWVQKTIAELSYIDLAVVSTDHSMISSHALDIGLEVPFKRPDALSGDFISDFQVLEHALIQCEDIYDSQFDIIVMLQPTSPLRTSGDVDKTIRKLIDEGLDSVWTVSPIDLKYHPFKVLKIDKKGSIDFYSDEAKDIIARQQLEPAYIRNGVAYTLTRETLLSQKTTKGLKTGAIILEDTHISIDTLSDIQAVEKFMAESKLT